MGFSGYTYQPHTAWSESARSQFQSQLTAARAHDGKLRAYGLAGLIKPNGKLPFLPKEDPCLVRLCELPNDAPSTILHHAGPPADALYVKGIFPDHQTAEELLEVPTGKEGREAGRFNLCGIGCCLVFLL